MDLTRIGALATIALCLFPALSVDASSCKKFDIPGYFVFGDSLVDVGTNNFLPNASLRANFPPYGETFFHKPTGRFSNGRNIGDFIAQALGLPFVPPFLQPNASFTKGVNFASGGSGLLNNTNNGTDLPMSVQLEQYNGIVRALLYNKLGADGAQKLISKSIFLIASGSNDLTSYFQNPELQKEFNATQYITLVIESYKDTLIEVYESGARKAIVFGAGPIGCSPIVSLAAYPTNPGECLYEANQFALGFNGGLKQLVHGLQVVLPDFNIVLADRYDLLYSMITDGKAFGLKNTKAACCGAGALNAQVQCGKSVPSYLPGVTPSRCRHPSKFLYWDFVHSTEHVENILFKKYWSSNSLTYPINFRTLATL